MEPSPIKRPDYEYGTYERADLRDVIEAIQQDPIDLLEEQAAALLKDPPTRQLRNLILDEGSRTPPPIQGSLTFGLMFIRDYRPALRSLDIPALVCAGADEKWRSAASVKYAADLIPNARFELFQESGHCITIEEPERFNRVLSDFIESL
jgi:pimeloyl-ACP methyl ester carboxylesterase